jgi:hypothetical protein
VIVGEVAVEDIGTCVVIEHADSRANCLLPIPRTGSCKPIVQERFLLMRECLIEVQRGTGARGVTPALSAGRHPLHHRLVESGKAYCVTAAIARNLFVGVPLCGAYCCCGTRTGGAFATALSMSSAESSGLIVTRAYPAEFVLNCAVAAAISSGYSITE